MSPSPKTSRDDFRRATRRMISRTSFQRLSSMSDHLLVMITIIRHNLLGEYSLRILMKNVLKTLGYCRRPLRGKAFRIFGHPHRLRSAFGGCPPKHPGAPGHGAVRRRRMAPEPELL